MNYIKFEKDRTIKKSIVDKVSESILHNISSYERMNMAYWDAREKTNPRYNPPRLDNGWVFTAFEGFYYYCIKKMEEGHFNEDIKKENIIGFKVSAANKADEFSVAADEIEKEWEASGLTSGKYRAFARAVHNRFMGKIIKHE